MGRSAVLKFSFTFNLAQLAMPMIGRIVAALKSLLALLSMTSCNDSIYHRGMKNIEFVWTSFSGFLPHVLKLAVRLNVTKVSDSQALHSNVLMLVIIFRK